MNYYPDIHARSASAEVTIHPHEFAPISNALNYAARVLIASDAAVDVESTYLAFNCVSEPEGLFDGVGASQGMDLNAQQIIDGDATLSLNVYGRTPGEIRTFRSIPEGSSSTATTTFIELVGTDQDLTHTYSPEHIAVLLDQVLGTHEEAVFSRIARTTADQPFYEFVSNVMKRASRFAKTKRTDQEYHGEMFDISPSGADSMLNGGMEYLQQTEATLAITRSARKATTIRSTLSAPVTISQHAPAPSHAMHGKSSTTLRETFEVKTPLINSRNLRALMRPVIEAKIQIENIGGTSLGRPNDLYMYAKNAADRVEPINYVHRSLQILNEHKELGLIDLR